MATSNILVVQGCYVFNINMKGDSIKAVLKGDKDTVRAGEEDISGLLKSLELHITAGDGAPIEVSLLSNENATTTYQHPFIVSSLLVKQDDVKIILETNKEISGEDASLEDVAKSLAIHSIAGEDKPVELTLARSTL
jgi:hypothetical protein